MAELAVRGNRIARVVLVTGLAGLGLLAAGCGGAAKTPAVASLPTTTSTRVSTSKSSPSSTGSTGATTPSFVAFANCMTSHGVQTSTGKGGHGIEITGVDPGSPELQAAQAACHKLLPGGGPPPLTPAQQAKRAQGLAAFAECMRKNGVPAFPDPNGQGQFPPDFLGQIDTNSPLVQTAYKACQSLFPKFGPQIGL